MHDDFKELLSILNAKRVKYLVVGGWAVSYHAEPRATKDLDLLIKADATNAKAIHAALKEFGAPVTTLAPTDLIEKGKFFRMGEPPIMVDILPEIKGVEFDHAWKRRVSVVVDHDRQLKAHFISDDDLIEAKMAAGRPQDIADVEALRKAKKASSAKPRRAKSTARPTKKPRTP